ncbi:MAG: hypothetical protein C4523_03870 [Myxococcales bacterium]|nr:MAG: hypothetical protein C4523_03870 [Myxococcales bacterium]
MPERQASVALEAVEAALADGDRASARRRLRRTPLPASDEEATRRRSLETALRFDPCVFAAAALAVAAMILAATLTYLE